jgi:membrane protein
VHEVRVGRSFLQRKATDIVSTFVLMALILVSLVLVFVGGGFADDLLGFLGLGPAVAHVWSIARWPAAVAVAMLVFALIYYVTPDADQRPFRRVIPGAAVGVLLWLLASAGFSFYVSRVADVGALYGAFAGAIVLVAWLWLTNVALLFGAELNAEIARSRP